MTWDFDDLRFRAWLGHPLVLYGHHEDVAPGLEVLATLAARVSTLGDSSWMDLSGLLKSNYWTRLDGRTLEVRMFTSRAELRIPAGIETLRVMTPNVGGSPLNIWRCRANRRRRRSRQMWKVFPRHRSRAMTAAPSNCDSYACACATSTIGARPIRRCGCGQSRDAS